MILGMRWLYTSRGGKLVLNGFGSDSMTASRLAVVSRIPEPKEEEREARASRGSSGAPQARVFGSWAFWPIMLVVFFRLVYLGFCNVWTLTFWVFNLL
ncbi:unnamed protein product [Brassica napus]|uniref:(rape) hypothetical protein n=1 Tax=Brassica napus TaxID=3708 RepID=A0A816QZE9_BRANA|nr:unnamed protein product [Brassica napus]